MDNNSILYLNKISKSFPGVNALSDVNFSIKSGEIVSLVGQNGAGKSTLMSIIAGLITPDDGEIYIEGEFVRITNAAIAEKLNIGIVHQEPTLVPSMSVSVNIFLGREVLMKYGSLNFQYMRKESMRILDVIGFKINPDELVENLSLVEREVVEIAKAMLFSPKILILDEVTAPLGAEVVENLFKLIIELKNKGIAIIFISHRLNEVIKLSDRVVVLRDGKVVGELNNKEKISEKDLINLMLGGKRFEVSKRDSATGIPKESVFEVKNLTKKQYFKNISFELYKGEIIGFAGLKGSGITEILRTIFGLEKKNEGEIFFKKEKLNILNPKSAMHYSIGMVTNDRQKEGLALIRSIEENINISSLDFLSNKLTFFRPKTLKQTAKNYITKLDIKSRSYNQEVLYLSGGNQQKVVIAKLLLRGLDIILFDEPTRGVDVNAKNEIHKLLAELKREGKSIIISSPEIPELLSICDRIFIVSMGEIIKKIDYSSTSFNEANILEEMHAGRM